MKSGTRQHQDPSTINSQLSTNFDWHIPCEQHFRWYASGTQRACSGAGSEGATVGAKPTICLNPSFPCPISHIHQSINPSLHHSVLPVYQPSTAPKNPSAG